MHFAALNQAAVADILCAEVNQAAAGNGAAVADGQLVAVCSGDAIQGRSTGDQDTVDVEDLGIVGLLALDGALVVDQAVYGAIADDHPAERGMNGATVDYIPVDLGTAVFLSFVASICACGASGVPGGSLMLIPLACGLFGIDQNTAMQVVAVGFIIGVLQDSCETALNSSSDALFTIAACQRAERLERGE